MLLSRVKCLDPGRALALERRLDKGRPRSDRGGRLEELAQLEEQ